MSTTKTWQARLGNTEHVQACGAVGGAMQAEIDELRAENERLRAVLMMFAEALPKGRETIKTCYGITNAMRDAAHAALGEKQ